MPFLDLISFEVVKADEVSSNFPSADGRHAVVGDDGSVVYLGISIEFYGCKNSSISVDFGISPNFNFVNVDTRISEDFGVFVYQASIVT